MLLKTFNDKVIIEVFSVTKRKGLWNKFANKWYDLFLNRGE